MLVFLLDLVALPCLSDFKLCPPLAAKKFRALCSYILHSVITEHARRRKENVHNYPVGRLLLHFLGVLKLKSPPLGRVCRVGRFEGFLHTKKSSPISETPRPSLGPPGLECRGTQKPEGFDLWLVVRSHVEISKSSTPYLGMRSCTYHTA